MGTRRERGERLAAIEQRLAAHFREDGPTLGDRFPHGHAVWPHVAVMLDEAAPAEFRHLAVLYAHLYMTEQEHGPEKARGLREHLATESEHSEEHRGYLARLPVASSP